MRNLKKILALALVFAMAFTFTASAASFTDAEDIGTNYVDDVNMLVELGVLAGYPDGSFGPQKNITRAEFAKMAYTLKYGSDADGDLFAAQASKFTDVQGNANVAWAKGYINYCANQNIVSGVGNNKFNPQGNITVAEAAKMILVILGCDPAKEGFTGANWMSNVVAKAIDLGVFNGWAGDPSALATRQLVAKLMRNAIFSPIYTYSAITGTGSQVNALGTAYNKTLGETTMGLYHESGIVVANEKNAINTDEEGEALKTVVATATNDDEKSVIYYTVTTSGVENGYLLPIDRGLSDELLGNKVDVYFKADVERNATTGEITRYYNPEVIGNVLVNSDTVVHNVASSEIAVYPNTNATGTSLIRPYITFADAKGEAVTITTPSTVGRYAKNSNGKGNGAVTAHFAQFAYVNDSARAINDNIYATVAEQIDAAVAAEIADDVETWKTNNPGYTAEALAAEIERLSAIELPVQTSAANLAFMADMAANTLAQYRFVSVDGGKTYSYIFKTEESAIANSYVTAYSSAKGTITLSNLGNLDLEDVVLKGDIAVDDMVVCYSVNSKLVVEKVEPFTGAVESFGDDGASVVINGKSYVANTNWRAAKTNLTASTTDLADFVMKHPEAISASTYYAYNNVVLRLDTEAKAVAASNYAVLLKSSVVDGIGYAVLGFADGTSKRYEVADKFYKMKDSGRNDNVTDFDNAQLGGLVKYKVLDNGTVDLSAQSFQTSLTGNDADYEYNKVRLTSITEGAVDGKYPESADSIIFVIYDNASTASTDVPEFSVYKISDIKGLTQAATTTTTMNNGNVIYDSNATTKNVVVASATVATSFSLSGATNFTAFTTDDETAKFAYVVKAVQSWNLNEEKGSAELTLINENGLFTIKTIEDVKNFNNDLALKDRVYGNISKPGVNQTFAEGSFVVYDVNAEGLIDKIAPSATALNTTVNFGGFGSATTAKGFYLVNVIGESDNRLTFYEASNAGDRTIASLSDSDVKSRKFDDDGCTIVTISDGEYVGSSIITLAENETTLKDDMGNAIIYINADNKIEYVYSFVDGIKK